MSLISDGTCLGCGAKTGEPHGKDCEPARLELEYQKNTNPNTRQIGGAHYKGGEYQHWDWVIDNKLGYFEGQVTKYICRWRAKNGIEDLKKAAHYLEKLISAYAEEKWVLPVPRPAFYQLRFFGTYELTASELHICSTMASYTTIAELQNELTEIEILIEREKGGQPEPSKD